MSILKKINQLKSLHNLVSREALNVRQLTLTSKRNRDRALIQLQELKHTYNLAIQAHNKLLSGNSRVNPQLIINTHAYLDRLQKDIDEAAQAFGLASAEVYKHENTLLKLVSKQKGYEKVTGNYIRDLRTANEKSDYLDSVKESANGKVQFS